MSEKNKVKLHLGCGAKKLSGWVNIDSVADFHPDLVHDIMNPLPYGDQTVDEILAEDLLEHFDKYMRFVVFADWARVLTPGGIVTVQVPNVKRILMKYFKFGFENFLDYMFGENLLRSETYLGHFGNHKWGYSEKSLQDFVKIFGVEPLEVKRVGLNIRLVGKKTRHVSVDELNKVMIYSHPNAHGIGKPSVSLGEAKEKIRIFQNDNK